MTFLASCLHHPVSKPGACLLLHFTKWARRLLRHREAERSSFSLKASRFNSSLSSCFLAWDMDLFSVLLTLQGTAEIRAQRPHLHTQVAMVQLKIKSLGLPLGYHQVMAIFLCWGVVCYGFALPVPTPGCPVTSQSSSLQICDPFTKRRNSLKILKTYINKARQPDLARV